MQQAAAGQGLSFDPLPFEQDRLTTSKVDVGGGEIAQALMSAGAIVVLHKGTDLRLQSARPAFTIERSTQLRSGRRSSCGLNISALSLMALRRRSCRYDRAIRQLNPVSDRILNGLPGRGLTRASRLRGKPRVNPSSKVSGQSHAWHG